MQEITIYTDGACKGNPGEGGWGAVLIYKDKQKQIKGFCHHTTNNKMELTAVIEALQIIKRPCKINLYTDSKYVKNGISCWINNWRSNNWKGANKKLIKNIDLWQKLDSLKKIHNIKWHWVKGHAGNEHNELADSLANLAIINKGDYM